MYCNKCGTVNPEIADFCLKCGREFGAARTPEEPTPLEISLASRPLGNLGRGPGGNMMSRLLVGGLAAALVFMVPTILLMRQMGQASQAAPGGTGALAVFGRTVGGASRNGGASPVSGAMAIANDAARKANAMRLKIGLAMFYEQDGRYPSSLSEIPASDLGFIPDADTYVYAPRPDGQGYRLEVPLQTNNVSGPNLVNEDGVTKYVIEVGPAGY